MPSIHGFTLQEIFQAAHLAKLGVSFDRFRSAPMATLKAVGQADAIDIMRAGFRPLLPAQVVIRRTLEAGWGAGGIPFQLHPHGQADAAMPRTPISFGVPVAVMAA